LANWIIISQGRGSWGGVKPTYQHFSDPLPLPPSLFKSASQEKEHSKM
jgi:hypothetical protein